MIEEKDAQIMVLEERGVDLEKENCRIKKENEGTKEDYQCLKREYEQQGKHLLQLVSHFKIITFLG